MLTLDEVEKVHEILERLGTGVVEDYFQDMDVGSGAERLIEKHEKLLRAWLED